MRESTNQSAPIRGQHALIMRCAPPEDMPKCRVHRLSIVFAKIARRQSIKIKMNALIVLSALLGKHVVPDKKEAHPPSQRIATAAHVTLASFNRRVGSQANRAQRTLNVLQVQRAVRPVQA